MKLIIAHLPNNSFDSARTALSELGVLRVTVSAVHTATTQSAISLRYRDTALETHLRSELKVECVTTGGQSPAVIDVLRGHAGSTGQVIVLDLELLHREDSQEPVFHDDPRLVAARQ